MSRNNSPLIVGLTGQTGAGKSTVSAVLAASGWAVIDADSVARVVVEPGTPCLEHLLAAFGESLRRPDGKLDRPQLAKIVFHDREQLERLGEIMYPCITEEILRRIEAYKAQGAAVILLDAPTLFESKASELCGCIVSVTAPEALREARIMARDGISREAARARMGAQLTEAFFIAHSDHIICNDGSIGQLQTQAAAIAKQIAEQARETG